jgi:hypothetical protein
MKKLVIALFLAMTTQMAFVQEASAVNTTCHRRCIREAAACARQCGIGVHGGDCAEKCEENSQNCMNSCNTHGNTFEACIKAAGNDEEAKKACRKEYMDNMN